MRFISSVLFMLLAALCAVQARPILNLRDMLDNLKTKQNLQWGPMGHYMAANIALNFLNANATQGCQNLLPDVNGDISLIASWADQMRDIWPWSAPLHYINTPDWACNYNRARDCVPIDGVPNFCVDGAIQNYTAQVTSSSVSSDDNSDALKFVVHFVGDIHQPLHVGFTSDEGGNTITGTFEGSDYPVRLHAIWDTSIIEKRLNDDYNGDNSSYVSYLVNRVTSGDLSSKVAGWQTCQDTSAPYGACSQEWAQESVQLACSNAYVDTDGNKIQDGFDLEDPYYNANYPVIEIQLCKAAVRMANVINNIFNEQAALGWPMLKKKKNF